MVQSLPPDKSSCGCGLRRKPPLENSHRPHLIVPIALAGKVLLPLLPDRADGKEAVASQTIGRQQVFRPLAERSAQPLIDRDPKSHLWPLHQLGRDMPEQNLPQDPLLFSIADLEAQ